MTSDLDVLRVATKELLPDNTRVFLAENGVKFYYKTTWPHQLYVKEDGKELHAPLSARIQIAAIDLRGNDIYFAGNNKGECVYAQGICSKNLNTYGSTNEYKHMSESKWFQVDCKTTQKGWASAMRIHRGKLLLTKPTMEHKLPRLYELGDTQIGVEGKFFYQSFAQHTSPFIYYCVGPCMYTLNMDDMDALPILRFESCYSDITIAGVYYGVITATAKCSEDGKYYLITAPFPDGYFDKGWPVTTLTAAMEKIKMEKEKLKLANVELVDRNSNITKELDRMKTLNEKIKSTNGALVDRNSELRQELDGINTLYDQISTSKCELEGRNSELTQELDRLNILNDEMSEIIKKITASECKDSKHVQQKLEDLQRQLIQCTIGSLTTVNRPLKFEQLEKLTKPLVCIQLDNGELMYFDNAKPFELFIVHDGNRVNADLKLWDGEFDCSFRGVVNNYAYFAAIRGKIIKFFRATIENGHISLEQIQEMKTSQISLFKSEPLYFIERSREWVVYKYDEMHTEVEGEKFNISDIDFLSKYERLYHRGILYLFREECTAKVEKVNEKVVIVEGPVLDSTSFYAPPSSNNIFILNSEYVLLILNTNNLTVSQLCYEAPAGTNNQSIVGIHDGMITMAFDGVWGRHLYTSKLQ